MKTQQQKWRSFLLQEVEKTNASYKIKVTSANNTDHWYIVGHFVESDKHKIWKRIPRFIRMIIAIISMFQETYDPDDKMILKDWYLQNDDGSNIVRYKKVAKGLKVFEQEKEVGNMLFKKREYLCKYETQHDGIYLGRLDPDSISHTRFWLRKDGETLMDAEKLHPWTKKDMRIFIDDRVPVEHFPVLFGVFLF